MAEEVIMPKLGMTMEEGVINCWHKEEGEEIKTGEVLLEVESDKANLEVEAEADGVLLKKLYQAGDSVPVTEIIGVISEPGEDFSDLIQEEKLDTGESTEPEDESIKDTEKTEPDNFETAANGKVKASPSARRIAGEEDINLSKVSGTGPDGRVIEQDVKDYLTEMKKTKATPAAKKIAAEKGVALEDIKKETGKRIYKDDIFDYAGETDNKTEKLTGFKKVAAKKLTGSWNEIPHVTETVEVDVTKTLELVNNINDKYTNRDKKISITDVLLKVCAHALKEYPAMNAVLKDETIIYNDQINIGLAVAVDDELVVPGLKNVARKGLKEINEQKHKLAEKARANQLSQEDISNNYFTISNLGMYGIEIFTPIINVPGSSILGVGKIKKKAVEVNGDLKFLPMMWFSLSFDHRLVNGVPAAKFLGLIKNMIEEPELLIY